MELTINILNTFGHIFVLGAGTDGLVQQVKDFIAPIALGIVAIMSLTFLFKRQFMQFLGFLVLAIGIFAIFFAPGIISGLGEQVGDANKGLSWQ